MPRRRGQAYHSSHCYDRVYNGRHPVIRKQLTLPGESRVERAFRDWICTVDGMRVAHEVVDRARRLRAAGRRSYGIAAIFEAIRYDEAVKLGGDPDGWRLNNNRRSLLARWIMARHEDLRGFFPTRDLRGRA